MNDQPMLSTGKAIKIIRRREEEPPNESQNLDNVSNVTPKPSSFKDVVLN